MGAWAHTSFGNDDAMDFIFEVEDDGDAAIRNAFDVVNHLPAADLLEAPDASVAIAAAEFVAAKSGKPSEALPPGAVLIVSQLKPLGNLKPEAKKAVQRVLNSSELQELWGSSNDFPAWQSTVEDLIERLK